MSKLKKTEFHRRKSSKRLRSCKDHILAIMRDKMKTAARRRNLNVAAPISGGNEQPSSLSKNNQIIVANVKSVWQFDYSRQILSNSVIEATSQHRNQVANSQSMTSYSDRGQVKRQDLQHDGQLRTLSISDTMGMATLIMKNGASYSSQKPAIDFESVVYLIKKAIKGENTNNNLLKEEDPFPKMPISPEMTVDHVHSTGKTKTDKSFQQEDPPVSNRLLPIPHQTLYLIYRLLQQDPPPLLFFKAKCTLQEIYMFTAYCRFGLVATGTWIVTPSNILSSSRLSEPQIGSLSPSASHKPQKGEIYWNDQDISVDSNPKTDTIFQTNSTVPYAFLFPISNFSHGRKQRRPLCHIVLLHPKTGEILACLMNTYNLKREIEPIIGQKDCITVIVYKWSDLVTANQNDSKSRPTQTKQQLIQLPLLPSFFLQTLQKLFQFSAARCSIASQPFMRNQVCVNAMMLIYEALRKILIKQTQIQNSNSQHTKVILTKARRGDTKLAQEHPLLTGLKDLYDAESDNSDVFPNSYAIYETDMPHPLPTLTPELIQQVIKMIFQGEKSKNHQKLNPDKIMSNIVFLGKNILCRMQQIRQAHHYPVQDPVWKEYLSKKGLIQSRQVSKRRERDTFQDIADSEDDQSIDHIVNRAKKQQLLNSQAHSQSLVCPGCQRDPNMTKVSISRVKCSRQAECAWMLYDVTGNNSHQSLSTQHNSFGQPNYKQLSRQTVPFPQSSGYQCGYNLNRQALGEQLSVCIDCYTRLHQQSNVVWQSLQRLCLQTLKQASTINTQVNNSLSQ